ncbi:MAG: non-canonical purine NTP diphosphatase [Bacteroidaceae bacterium]|nr:non-canonical purine NTP diphosphatase [Bacteroidaceae bacterium]
MKKIVFATNNAHKLQEVSEILEDKIQIMNLKDIHCEEEIPETSDNIEGNAYQKANYIYEHYHVDCFADDTGLEVEALNGAPGVYSARYAGPQHNSKDNIRKLLTDMQDIENRNAQFRTAIVLILDGKIHLFEGTIKGTIIRSERGSGGFGYDSVFVPDGFEKTFAELGEEIKNKISHRAIATKKLVKFLLHE